MNLTFNEPKCLENSNWVEGSLLDKDSKNYYSYCAKLFPEPSCFGIFDGRISKMSVKNGDGKLIFNYDRGWDVGDKKDASQGILKELISYLENFAQTDEYRARFEDICNS